MSLRVIIFVAVLGTAISLMTYYLGLRFLSRSEWLSDHRRVVWLALIAFVVLQVMGPLMYRVFPDHFSRLFIIQWITYTSLGVFSCLLFYVLVSDAFIGLSRFVIAPDTRVDLERRSFLIVGFLTLVTSIIGYFQAYSGPKIFEIDIPLTNLPKELDGFRIVQISDLHVGPLIGKEYVQNVVKLANGLDPDLVALTGDFVDGSVEQLRSEIAPLAELKARYGKFFVTGNHEYYWGAHAWCKEHEAMGARVLLNEHVRIQAKGQEFVLAGVTDYKAGQIIPEHESDPAKSLVNAPKDGLKILLAHQPGSFEAAAQAGFHLQLSGHTHGGQFFPWSLVVALAHRYFKGLNRHNNQMWVYVNRGTGYWGPPLRFGVPAEITLIRLKTLAGQEPV